jgi:hypothetical protein
MGFATTAAVVVLAVVLGRGVGAAATDAAVAEAHASEGLAAFREVRAAFTGQRWRDAGTAADRAVTEFEATSTALGDVPGSIRLGLSVLPAGRRLGAAEHLAEAGRSAAQAASILAGFADRNLRGGTSALTLPTLLTRADELVPVLDAVDHAIDEVAAVDPKTFDGEVGESLARFAEGIPVARTLSREVRDAITLLPSLLGTDGPREYLVLFQNAAERRPTGGFLGSLLGVRFDRGIPTVTDAPGRGPFDIDDRLPAIAPPNPILRVTNRWTLHDSNWSPDFPTAAAKAQSFYEEARGYTVDGVIAITSTLLPQLLGAVGPLTLPDGTVLTEETALTVIQNQVERGYDRASNQPKAIVAPLFVALSERIRSLQPDQAGAVLEVLRDSIPTRLVQLYSSDSAFQSNLRAAGWSGGISGGAFDTFGLFGANLGGGKSDRVTDDSLTFSVAIDRSGTVTDTVTYLRSHRGVPADTLAGLTNRAYLRFLVPTGSTLNSATGFTSPDPSTFFAPAQGVRSDPDASAASAGTNGADGMRIMRESGFESFGNWLDVPPQSGAAARISYQLPNRVPSDGLLSTTHTYRLRLLHQGGTSPSVLLRFVLPNGAKPVISSIPLTPRNGGFEGSLILDRDIDLTVLYR